MTKKPLKDRKFQFVYEETIFLYFNLKKICFLTNCVLLRREHMHKNWKSLSFLNGFVAETVFQVRLTDLDQRSSQPHLNSWRYPLINYLDDGDEVVVVLGFMWTTRLTILCLYSPYLKTKCENKLLIGSSDDFTKFYSTNLRIF